MALKARSTGGASKDLPEVDTHMARLVGLVDLGHQPGFEWNGKQVESAYKIEFVYELVNSFMKDGRPHWVSEEVKVNDYEGKGIVSTMMARVRTLDKANDSNDGKDLVRLLGKPCMVTLSAGANGYPKIKGQAAISSIPAGMPVPDLVNDTFAFDMEDPDMGVWEKLSEFTKDRVKRALDYSESVLAKELQLEDNL